MKKVAAIFTAVLLSLALSANALAAMIFIEAESGIQSSDPMIVGSGSGAFNGSYIYGEENSYERISYEFEVAEAGDYYLWFRLMGQDDEHNSFFVMIDGAGFDQGEGYVADGYYTFDMWEPSEGYEYSENNPFLPSLEDHKNPEWIYNPNWQWIPLAYRDATDDPPIRHILVTQNFSAGKHTMEIMTREPETYLDKILITNDLAYDPRIISGDPEAAYLEELAAAEAAREAAEADEAAQEEPEAVVAEEVLPPPAAAVNPPQTSDGSALAWIGLLFMPVFCIWAIRRRKCR
ncbi:MAG: hypothetical protein FWG34_04410 [Oscillospiraceae bacterium]|nr:hypothetical protein [Oscillospiraceae bacterium]